MSITDEDFESFYKETAAPLRAYLSRAGGDDTLADDLLQSAYLRFLQARRLPSDPSARKVYLFRIATNLLRDEFRRNAAHRRRTDRLASSSGSFQLPRANDWRVEPAVHPRAESAESRMVVRRALREVTPRDRELLWLAYGIGMSHREISEVTNVGEGSVRVLLGRARRRFVQVLKNLGLGPEDAI